MKQSKKFYLKADTKCMRNQGFGWEQHTLVAADYDISTIKEGKSEVYFELWDEEGLIGKYFIAKKDFESKFSTKKVLVGKN